MSKNLLSKNFYILILAKKVSFYSIYTTFSAPLLACRFFRLHGNICDKLIVLLRCFRTICGVILTIEVVHDFSNLRINSGMVNVDISDEQAAVLGTVNLNAY